MNKVWKSEREREREKGGRKENKESEDDHP